MLASWTQTHSVLSIQTVTLGLFLEWGVRTIDLFFLLFGGLNSRGSDKRTIEHKDVDNAIISYYLGMIVHDRLHSGVAMSEMVASLAEAVRARRVELGLRQADLAELAGCSRRFVNTLEQGKPTLRLDKLLDVLEVLGLGLSVVPGQGTIESSPPPRLQQ